MTQTLPGQAIDTVEPDEAPALPRPSRLVLRRRLLLWSIPGLVLLALLSVKLASVGVLGNKLPGQFAAHDPAAMDATLSGIGVGGFGRGVKGRLAAGDMLMLRGELPAAREQFEASLNKAGEGPEACPARVNFALTSESLSDSDLKAGNFAAALELLEPAVSAAGRDEACFARAESPNVEIRVYIGQTPQRLNAKLAALKGGRLTKTADGYDYMRAPGGMIDFTEYPTEETCPHIGDEVRMRECIDRKDHERTKRIKDAERKRQAKEDEDKAKKPKVYVPCQYAEGDPRRVTECVECPPEVTNVEAGQQCIVVDAEQRPGEPAGGEAAGGEAAGAEAGGEPTQVLEFPAGGKKDPNSQFCEPTGDPLHDLGTTLCETSGPLP